MHKVPGTKDEIKEAIIKALVEKNPMTYEELKSNLYKSFPLVILRELRNDGKVKNHFEIEEDGTIAITVYLLDKD